jgi:hypothetical protein
MLMKRLLIGGTIAVAAVATTALPANAQVRGDKAVYFTFSAPVTVPNAELPAGKYLFRLADSLVNRQIVQIYSADGSKLHAMLMTLPQIRQQASNRAEVRFLETAANQAPAVATWWYPGERTGWEFIYPREQARRLAQAAKTNVLTTAQNVPSTDMSSGDLVRVSPTGEQTPAASDSEAPAFNASDRTAAGETAMDAPDFTNRQQTPSQASSTTATQSAQAQPSARQSLPATASFVPAAALAGVVAFLAAFAMRTRRTRRA